MRAVEWESCRIHEIDLTSTELSAECLQDVLCRIPALTFLGLGYCEFFNDKVGVTFLGSNFTVQCSCQFQDVF